MEGSGLFETTWNSLLFTDSTRAFLQRPGFDPTTLRSRVGNSRPNRKPCSGTYTPRRDEGAGQRVFTSYNRDYAFIALIQECPAALSIGGAPSLSLIRNTSRS